jgi:hypothetical protein
LHEIDEERFEEVHNYRLSVMEKLFQKYRWVTDVTKCTKIGNGLQILKYIRNIIEKQLFPITLQQSYQEDPNDPPTDELLYFKFNRCDNFLIHRGFINFDLDYLINYVCYEANSGPNIKRMIKYAPPIPQDQYIWLFDPLYGISDNTQ